MGDASANTKGGGRGRVAWRLRDQPGPPRFASWCLCSASGSPLYASMARKPRLLPSHTLLQSLPPAVAAPPPCAGAGGWPEWTGRLPGGQEAPARSGGEGDRGRRTGVAEAGCLSTAAALLSNLQVLHFSLKHRHGGQRSRLCPCGSLAGTVSPCTSPLPEPTFPAGKRTPGTLPDARPEGTWLLRRADRLLCQRPAHPCIVHCTVLLAAVAEPRFLSLATEEFRAKNSSPRSVFRSLRSRPSRWPRAALGAGKGSLSQERPTLPFSISVNNQISVNYCCKEPEQEGR